MSTEGSVVDAVAQQRQIGPGTILVSRTGQIKILRSRNKLENGWNCADGAGIADDDVHRCDLWRAYSPEELAADLALAADLNDLRGHRVLGGGLATWDACSGRPCVLPKLAKLVH
jgi:hypothetical protein